MSISLKGVSKQFGDVVAVDNISLEAPTGKLLALLGPSGSGKSTLLRVIAGLETPDRGTVYIHDKDVTTLAPKDRNVGFLFQQFALFPHMTVAENIAFGMRVRGTDQTMIVDRIGELLRLIRLEGIAERFPWQLSGGQRQRVALARALAPKPRILLLDEPFGSLDAKVRVELRRWLAEMHQVVQITIIFVTHDQNEAAELADSIAILNNGRLVQVGSYDQIINEPANEFVLDFAGQANQFFGKVQRGRVHFAGCEMPLATQGDELAADVRVFVRPHNLEVLPDTDSSNAIVAELVRFRASEPMAVLQLGMGEKQPPFIVHVPSETLRGISLQPGSRIHVRPTRIHVFQSDGLPVGRKKG